MHTSIDVERFHDRPGPVLPAQGPANAVTTRPGRLGVVTVPGRVS